MKRLMKALGDDGLDEFGEMQLESLAEQSGDEESDEEGGESESESEAEEDIGSVNGKEVDDDMEGGSEDHEEEEDDEGEGEDVLLDDVESVDDDTVPRQKLEIDNKVALERIRETIKLDSALPWTETLAVTYRSTIDVDVEDDLSRELAFYKQALDGANTARTLAAQHKLPFTRPPDYFAEMVKSDAHMERVRQRLLDESATIKRGEEKKKEREGKKFGKQMQIEKLKERERSKKDMDEKLKSLKRKRKDGALDNPQDDGDAFDVAVEDAISDRPAKRGRGGAKTKMSRTARDGKFGFGGKDRRSKQNTRESTETFDFGGGRGSRGGRGGGRGGRGGGKRLGKSRRMNTRGK
ncbi:eukaryotic rRNA processing [Rickenella mellea]|uniref:Eukaryotic rRNA processing n=1 Tax=Rickenella mellea TaxID=50990 RepID=A0A4Y7PS90_9AGAM|nr:eukaryotic rRNA processing [Rickenella mellea]